MNQMTSVMGRPTTPTDMQPPRRHHADRPLSTDEYIRRIHDWLRAFVVAWLVTMILAACTVAFFAARASAQADRAQNAAYEACAQATTLMQCATLFGK